MVVAVATDVVAAVVVAVVVLELVLVLVLAFVSFSRRRLEPVQDCIVYTYGAPFLGDLEWNRAMPPRAACAIEALVRPEPRKGGARRPEGARIQYTLGCSAPGSIRRAPIWNCGGCLTSALCWERFRRM